MKNTASPTSAAVPLFDQGLAEVATRLSANDHLSLRLDFDGTLAPIVPNPDAATIPDQTRRVMSLLASCSAIDVAVISGRELFDVKSRVDLDGITFAGNHGLEIERNDQIWRHPAVFDVKDKLNRTRRRIEAQLVDIHGAFIEDKGITTAVHYRQADSNGTQRVQQIATREIDRSDDLQAIRNDQVIDIRPNIDWGKGNAIDVLTAQTNELQIYIGDDTTDVDAFRVLAADDVHIRIAVGQDRPFANFIVNRPVAVRSFLTWLTHQPIAQSDI